MGRAHKFPSLAKAPLSINGYWGERFSFLQGSGHCVATHDPIDGPTHKNKQYEMESVALNLSRFPWKGKVVGY